MTIGNIDTKNVTAIFDKSNQDKKKIVSEACEYWVNQILNFDRQISNEMGNGIINVTDRDLLKFRKVFNGYILKHFPKKGNIMLWTSNGEYFESIGTDSYLENIMRIAKLPITILPSDICMWIYSEKIEIEDRMQHQLVYSRKK